ncbi:pilus assembly protein PilB [Tamilnaduibacter salinus]|uniref:Pilus assembly protein PilB n=1 Tax=Tamilnaduibacter salinus TaxID=1484056 RepID=A0A2A2I3Y3_9GAMM|nr:pilus assembly protein PilB [Tamilnaduibacter salinus]PAV26302.1 pilus assembly protein PilB [Tamilnaduibacter salinus]
MKQHQGQIEKSRLGRLLVNRGLIDEGQLEQALAEQQAEGIRLGELLVARGVISERELSRVLKHQSRYRNAAAFVAMFTLPLQPVVTFAATAPAPANAATQSAQMLSKQGFTPLSEDDLSDVSARGSLMAHVDALASMAEDAETGEPIEADPVEGIELAAHTFVPILNFLDSDLTISGVHYRGGEAEYTVLADGGLRMALPERIDTISMNNIRVSGSRGASLGNVSLHGIHFSEGSHVTIRTRP